MLNKKLYLSVFASALVATASYAEPEISGKIIHESGFFTDSGTTIGADKKTLSTTWSNDLQPHDTLESFKTETSARIYVDGEANELKDGATYHVELNLMMDPGGVGKHDSNDEYTQRDMIREAYVDTSYEDWALRLGKQQVVWGTADGAKFLDLINPTDFSEMSQNQMEDSRIPVWMLNAEKPTEDGGSFQFVVSQPRENVFAGLDRNINTAVRGNNTSTFADETSDAHSQGHAFMLKGPDAITGYANGMLNIVPDLGGVARRFAWGFGTNYEDTDELGSGYMHGFTLDLFEGMKMSEMAAAMDGNGMLGDSDGASAGDWNHVGTSIPTNTNYTGGSGYELLPDAFEGAVDGVATARSKDANDVTGQEMLAFGFAPYYNTTLANYNTSAADATFDYMGSTTFYTFDAFVNAKSQYVYNMPSDTDFDLAMRYKNTTPDGTNYSFVLSNNYDKNPIINLSWRNSDGDLLYVVPYTASGSANTSLLLNSQSDGNGTAYGGKAGKAPILRFEQTVERAVNLGGSFDTTLETDQFGPVVVRGEAVYQKDVYSPVFDKSKLAIGDLVGALKMVKGDKMKYVIGADITALTNMMVSLQFIQEQNLDYVNGAQSNGRYTADYATMSLLNGFQKAEKNKEYVSMYLSKPFGESGQHRWNNITMFEDTGGRWNRLDVEYTIDDNTIATAEYNKYWGGENTTLGQLEDSSNVQLGFKLLF